MNDEARDMESMSIVGLSEVKGDSKENTISKNLTLRDIKIFLRVGSKQRKAL